MHCHPDIWSLNNTLYSVEIEILGDLNSLFLYTSCIGRVDNSELGNQVR